MGLDIGGITKLTNKITPQIKKETAVTKTVTQSELISIFVKYNIPIAKETLVAIKSHNEYEI